MRCKPVRRASLDGVALQPLRNGEFALRLFAASGLSNPLNLAFDLFGNLYVANNGDSTVEKFDSAGNGTLLLQGTFLVDNKAFVKGTWGAAISVVYTMMNEDTIK